MKISEVMLFFALLATFFLIYLDFQVNRLDYRLILVCICLIVMLIINRNSITTSLMALTMLVLLSRLHFNLIALMMLTVFFGTYYFLKNESWSMPLTLKSVIIAVLNQLLKYINEKMCNLKWRQKTKRITLKRLKIGIWCY